MDVQSSYAKPFLTIPQQIHRMRQRGMDCGADREAALVLQRYGYYRLSGYSHPYRMRPVPPAAQVGADGREIRYDTFVPGTTLSKVAEIYAFDDELRSRVADALRSLEVSFRFLVGHRLGKLDAFAHRRPGLLGAMRPPAGPVRRFFGSLLRRKGIPTKNYRDWIAEYDRHEKRAKDRFVLHFRSKYGTHLPIWVGTEVMSFGVLSNLYRLMPEVDQEILAARFQILAKSGRGDSGALANWLNNLRNIRNTCAHYGRLWNRTFDVLIDTPGQAQAGVDSSVAGGYLRALRDRTVNNKIYGVLLIMRHLMLSTDPNRGDIVDIVEFAEREASRIGLGLSDMGFPIGWRTEPVWQPGFRLPEGPMIAASMLDQATCLTTNEVKKLLTSATPKASPCPRTPEQEKSAINAARRDLLRTYRRYGTLIEVPLAGVHYFPSFQFREGAMVDAVGEINKAFIDSNAGVDKLAVHSSLLHWWQTPQSGLPLSQDGSESSPEDVLGAMSEAEFVRSIQDAGATVSLKVR